VQAEVGRAVCSFACGGTTTGDDLLVLAVMWENKASLLMHCVIVI
jgi:hypothetical protein